MEKDRNKSRHQHKVCLLDGKIERLHMGRHYERHHNHLSKHDRKMVVLNKHTVTQTQLLLSQGQQEKDVVWCDNWKEIAMAIVNNQEKPEPINPKAQYIGMTKDNRLKSRDRSGHEVEVAASSHHQDKAKVRQSQVKAPIKEKGILSQDGIGYSLVALLTDEKVTQPAQFVQGHEDEEEKELGGGVDVQIQNQVYRQNIQISADSNRPQQQTHNLIDNTDQQPQLLPNQVSTTQQRDSTGQDNILDVDIDDLAECLSDYEPQPLTSKKSTKFTLFRGERNNKKMANYGIDKAISSIVQVNDNDGECDKVSLLVDVDSSREINQDLCVATNVLWHQIMQQEPLSNSMKVTPAQNIYVVEQALLQVQTFKLFDFPNNSTKLKMASTSITMENYNEIPTKYDKSQQINIVYGLKLDTNSSKSDIAFSMEQFIEDIYSQLGCEKLLRCKQVDVTKNFPTKWLYQNSNLDAKSSTLGAVNFKKLQLFKQSGLIIAVSVINQGSEDSKAQMRLECLCTSAKMDFTQVSTFVTKFINLCTQHEIVILNSRLKIERSMVNISMGQYDEICELLHNQQRLVHKDTRTNSLLNFWRMEHKTMATTQNWPIQVINDQITATNYSNVDNGAIGLGKRRTVAGNSAVLEAEIGNLSTQITNCGKTGIEKMVKIGMNEKLQQFLIEEQSKANLRSSELQNQICYKEDVAKAQELHQLAQTIEFNLKQSINRKGSVELNELVLLLQRKKELGQFKKREQLVRAVKTLCTAIPDWIELKKTPSGEFIKRSSTKYMTANFLENIKSYLISQHLVDNSNRNPLNIESSLMNQTTKGVDLAIKMAVGISEANGKLLKQVYIDQQQQISANEVDADMAYDTPLPISPVQQSEIVEFISKSQILTGAHKDSAAKAWTSMHFKGISEAYEPLKRHNKRTTKYRRKLDKQFKAITDRMLDLQDQVGQIKQLQDKTYDKVQNTAPSNTTVNNNNYNFNNNNNSFIKQPKIIKHSDGIEVTAQTDIQNYLASLGNENIKTALMRFGYQCQKIVGQGGFGVVYLCQRVKQSKDKERHQYAVKVQRQDMKVNLAGSSMQEQTNTLTAEMQAIQRIKDKSIINGKEYVVEILDVLQLEGVGQAFVMPYYKHTLTGVFESIQKQSGMTTLCETTKYKLAEGIIRGVCAAHKAGVVHKDIKPANIMIEDNQMAKLADFGLTNCNSLCGTKTYMAPELFEVTQSDKIDWFKADAWSLGIVIFQLFEDGRHPFASNAATIKFDKTPTEVQGFIAELLHPNPTSRKYVTQAKNANLFFKAVGFETNLSLFEKACKKHGISETDKKAVNLAIDFATLKGHLHISQRGGKKRTDLETRVTAAMKEVDIEFADWSQSSASGTPQKESEIQVKTKYRI